LVATKPCIFNNSNTLPWRPKLSENALLGNVPITFGDYYFTYHEQITSRISLKALAYKLFL